MELVQKLLQRAPIMALRSGLLSLALFASVTALVTGCSGSESEDADSATGAVNRDEQGRDPLREAVKNVDEERVMLGASIPVPTEAGYVSQNGFSLSGVDWFQQWSGGVSANHDFSIGTDNGKRCMKAAVYRFEEIMKNPPRELVALVAQQKEMGTKRSEELTRLGTEIDALAQLGDRISEEQKEKLESLKSDQDSLRQLSTWGGSFYNWVDDYNHPQANGEASHAKLWAWRSGLTKWISSSGSDGSCYLPTRKMLVDYAADCTAQSSSVDKEVKGCSVNW